MSVETRCFCDALRIKSKPGAAFTSVEAWRGIVDPTVVGEIWRKPDTLRLTYDQSWRVQVSSGVRIM